MDKVFTRYLRDVDGNPFGFVVLDPGGFYGSSLCCPRDKFRKELARTIALGRLAKKKNHIADLLGRITAPYRKREQAAATAILDLWNYSLVPWLEKQIPDHMKKEGPKGGAMK
jgi:hypothetical protein